MRAIPDLADRRGYSALPWASSCGPRCARSAALQALLVEPKPSHQTYTPLIKQKALIQGPSALLAEREGFEPSWGLRPQRISSPRRYGHFGTSPRNAGQCRPSVHFWPCLWHIQSIATGLSETDAFGPPYNNGQYYTIPLSALSLNFTHPVPWPFDSP